MSEKKNNPGAEIRVLQTRIDSLESSIEKMDKSIYGEKGVLSRLTAIESELKTHKIWIPIFTGLALFIVEILLKYGFKI